MRAGIWCELDSLLFRQRNTYIRYAWHNLTFHTVYNGDMQGVTAVELDVVKGKGICKKTYASSPHVAILVYELTNFIVRFHSVSRENGLGHLHGQ